MSETAIRGTAIYIGNHAVDLGPVRIDEELSRGANGVVFGGYDELLLRPVAVKVWQRLRSTDHRDKLQQGMLEAQKAWQAKSKNVVEVFNAGVAHGCIYLVMEYIAGRPLKDWLANAAPSLGVRWNLAYALTRTLRQLDEKGMRHGDLHTTNIMIVPVAHEALLYDMERRQLLPGHHSRESITYKIIDFGTSHFSGRGYSAKRHYRLVEETLDALLHPFSIEVHYGHARQTGLTVEFYAWVDEFLWRLCLSLLALGFHNVAMPLHFAVDPYMGYDPEEDLSSSHDSRRLLENVRRTVRDRDLRSEFVGTHADWNDRIS